MTIFTRDEQTLYLTSWDYNSVLIIKELIKIVENAGGTVKPAYHTGYIVNRSLLEKIQDTQKRIDTARDKLTAAQKKIYIHNLQCELEQLQSRDNAPVKVANSNYISFVLDGIYYYVELDDNPFFDFYYSKKPVVNGKVSKNAYLDKLDKEWLYDCYLSYDCTNTERREAAYCIYNALIQAKNSEIYRETTKKRVANTYNSGYHYETVTSPERFETVDFLQA